MSTIRGDTTHLSRRLGLGQFYVPLEEFLGGRHLGSNEVTRSINPEHKYIGLTYFKVV